MLFLAELKVATLNCLANLVDYVRAVNLDGFTDPDLTKVSDLLKMVAFSLSQDVLCLLFNFSLTIIFF